MSIKSDCEYIGDEESLLHAAMVSGQLNNVLFDLRQQHRDSNQGFHLREF